MIVDIVNRMNEMIDSINKIEERLNNIERKPKRRRLKKWVENVLIVFNILLLVVMASDCDDLMMFTITHLSALLLFIVNNLIIAKYGRLFEE